MKKKTKRIFLGVSSGVLLIIAVAAQVAGNYALNDGSAAINMAFNTSFTKTVEDPNADPVLKFRSKYKWMPDDNAKYEREVSEMLFEEDNSIIESSTEEGVVLLWNKDSALPTKSTDVKVSLLGHASAELVEGGSGSGWIQPKSLDGKSVAISMKAAFEEKGFEVNNTLWNFYVSGKGSSYKATQPGTACTEWRQWKTNEVPWSVYDDATKNSFASYGDIAVITLSRNGGEYSDLHYNYSGYSDKTGGNAKGSFENKPENGGYLGLTDEETDLLKNVSTLKRNGTFKKVVLLLNTGNPIQFEDIEDTYGDIDACMWIGQPGSAGIRGVVDLLKGQDKDGNPVTPSGHLSDTFMYDLNSAPATENDGNYQYSGDLSKLTNSNNRYSAYMVYQEGIYVGYRYFETRYEDCVLNQGNADDVAGAKHSLDGWEYDDEVAFPFGYGESYTKFEYSDYKAERTKDGNFKVTVKVKNVGTVAGKEVVQVYLQKPYTEYDKTNLVEKAAVELVGYAKTNLLKANESETVEIPVRYEDFKSYDANKEKTYIVEAGDYYLTVGADSHNAINNILGVKTKKTLKSTFFGGYKKTNTTNLDKSFVSKFTLEKDTKFSKSTQTGETITNQLDGGDINKYENKGENSVTYLSRSDWKATYPKTPVLKMNDKMAVDLKPDTVPDDTGYEMPAYGVFASGEKKPNPEAGDLVAMDFIDAPLFPEKGDPKEEVNGKTNEEWARMWDQLLDQMTFAEQSLMSANAYHCVNGASSINLPSTRQENGPVGITKRSDFGVPDAKIKYYFFVSYPNAPLLASTFNKDVVEDVGEHMSEDMFFLGYNGIYGPGVNMHRTPYGGRAYEYPSEDPFLAGTIEYAESKGIESLGCMAFAKHFALNDTETNRRHVGVWSTEQASREIYLKAFELCFAEGGASATMNSFSRVGTKWNGGCYAVMTQILRNEWGWDGINITDWMSNGPMSYVDAIVGGTNSFDGNGSTTSYSTWKNNKLVCQKLRESAKIIIYNIVRTNAFNSFSAATEVFDVTPWWVTGIKIIQNTTITITCAVAALFAYSMITYFLGWDKKEEEAK